MVALTENTVTEVRIIHQTFVKRTLQFDELTLPVDRFLARAIADQYILETTNHSRSNGIAILHKATKLCWGRELNICTKKLMST